MVILDGCWFCLYITNQIWSIIDNYLIFSNFDTYSSRPISNIWKRLDPPLTGNPTMFDTFSQWRSRNPGLPNVRITGILLLNSSIFSLKSKNQGSRVKINWFYNHHKICSNSISKNSRHNLNWKYLTLTTSSLADGISQNSLSRCDTSFQELFTSASISYNDITVLEYIATQWLDTSYYCDLKISLLFLRKIITLGSCVPIGLSNQVFCLFINSIDVS